MKKTAKFLSFIAYSSNLKIILVIVGFYLGIAVLFSLLYSYFDISSLCEIGLTNKMIKYLYISFQIQTTIGTNYDFSSIGKFLVVLHQIISIFYIAIIPAIAVIKIANPTYDSITFCKYLVFYPELKCFRTRYVNRAGIVATDMEFDIRHKIPVDDEGTNYRNLDILLQTTKVSDARPMVSYYLRTKETDTKGQEYIDGTKDFKLILHPSHLYGDMKLRISIKCNYLIAFRGEKIYEYNNIVCGKIIPLYSNLKGKKYWKDFHNIERIEKTKLGREKCRMCEFKERCRISNKAV